MAKDGRSPFDYIKNINKNKSEDMMPEVDSSTDGYTPFIINRSFSSFPDTILYANEVNRYYGLPLRQQYHFYKYSIRPRNRFAPWEKQIKDETIEAIKKVFGCNSKRAQETMSILSEDQLKEVTEIYNQTKGNTK